MVKITKGIGRERHEMRNILVGLGRKSRSTLSWEGTPAGPRQVEGAPADTGGRRELGGWWGTLVVWWG